MILGVGDYCDPVALVIGPRKELSFVVLKVVPDGKGFEPEI